jgi:hypothetical protein
MKTEKQYFIGFDFPDYLENDRNYISLKMQIDSKGFIEIMNNEKQKFKVFTAQLAYILTTKELKVTEFLRSVELKINGWDYVSTYIEAYKQGEQYFENEVKVSPNTIYGANAELYVRDIHLNFFHVQHTGTKEGWGYVKKQYPITLTHKEVKEFGYYSGIVNKVEEQVKKYPQLFAAFDKCEHNLPPQQTETNKLKAPVLGLFCNLVNEIGIDKKDETESASVYCERICDKFKLPYTDRVRQNYSVNETKKLLKELAEKILPLIDNETKNLVQKYLDSKQPPKPNLYA